MLSATLFIGNLGMLFANVVNVAAIPLQMPMLFLLSRVFGMAFVAVNFGALTLLMLECPATNLRGPANFIAGTMFTAVNVLGMVLGMDSVLGHNLTLLVGMLILIS